MKAIAKDTLQYEEYNSPNWVEGETYPYRYDGDVLIIGSEQGTEFRFLGSARTFMEGQFDLRREDGDQP